MLISVSDRSEAVLGSTADQQKSSCREVNRVGMKRGMQRDGGMREHFSMNEKKLSFTFISSDLVCMRACVHVLVLTTSHVMEGFKVRIRTGFRFGLGVKGNALCL